MFLSRLSACVLTLVHFASTEICAQNSNQTPSRRGTIIVTVLDVNGEVVRGANIRLLNGGSERRGMANGNGFFSFNEITPGVPCQVVIDAPGFASRTAEVPDLTPGQFYILTNIRLHLTTVRRITKRSLAGTGAQGPMIPPALRAAYSTMTQNRVDLYCKLFRTFST